MTLHRVAEGRMIREPDWSADHGPHGSPSGTRPHPERDGTGRTRPPLPVAVRAPRARPMSPDHSRLGRWRSQRLDRPSLRHQQSDRLSLAEEVVRAGSCGPLRRSSFWPAENLRRGSRRRPAAHRSAEEADRRHTLDGSLRRLRDRPLEEHRRPDALALRRAAAPLEELQAFPPIQPSSTRCAASSGCT
jgi:hypothetical protein